MCKITKPLLNRHQQQNHTAPMESLHINYGIITITASCQITVHNLKDDSRQNFSLWYDMVQPKKIKEKKNLISSNVTIKISELGSGMLL